MRTLGPEHPAVARTLYNLGVASSQALDPTAARGWFEEAFTVGTAAGVVEVANHAQARVARLKMADGDAAGAKANYLEAAASLRAFGIEDTNVADWLYRAALCAGDLGAHDEAADLYGDVLTLRRELLGDDDFTALEALFSQAGALRSAGRFEEAEERALEVLERMLATKGPNAPEVARIHELLVQLYEDWGRPEDAELWRD